MSASDWDAILGDSQQVDKEKKPQEKPVVAPQAPSGVHVKETPASSPPVVISQPTSAPVAATPPSTPVTDDWGAAVSVPEGPAGEPKQVDIQKEALPFDAAKNAPTPAPTLRQTLAAPEFDMGEVTEQSQLVLTIYAHKNHGKTAAAFSLPGSIACLSFDKKAYPIKANMFNNDARIHVYDAIRYLDESDPSIMLDSNVNTLKYIFYLLDELAKSKPDFIIIDGTEVEQAICEMVMRARNNLTPFEGVSWTFWKERKVYLKQIHRRAMSACKRGIVYTTYVDQDEIIKNGETYNKTDRPKWMGIQLEETDVVIRITSEDDGKSGRHYFASIEGSKVPLFRTGDKKEITNIGLAKAFGVK